MDASAREILRQAFGERVRFDEPLERHTSFRIGGPADAWLVAESLDDVATSRRLASQLDLPLWVLGGGTNVLVSDRGVRGLVLHLGRTFSTAEWLATDVVRAGAAMVFKKLVLATIERGLAGLEFAEGIPGSVGGGLLMNAGAFGGEIANVVESVEGVDHDAAIVALPRERLHFGYRHFDLPRGLIVTHVRFRMTPDDPQRVRERREAARQKRLARQPAGFPNAGSVFKNPPGTFAGRLIESVGLKGRRIGNAQISPAHANFIVNLGGATAADVRALMNEAIGAVAAAQGVQLEPEIKLVGEWE